MAMCLCTDNLIWQSVCSTSWQDKDLLASQASIANMGMMHMVMRMTDAQRVPFSNPNAICGEALLVALSISGPIAAVSGPF